MKTVLFSAAILLMVAVHASAETAVPDQTVFGAQDSRGAYQEVRIKPFKVAADYFPSSLQDVLRSDAADQAKNSVYANDDKTVLPWGRQVQIVFQGGELRTENSNTTAYKAINAGEAQARLYVSLAFDSAEQAEAGVYEVSGIVTLVSGNSYSGPINVPIGPLPIADQIIELGYKNSSAYYHNGKVGGAFNAYGNGKNDGGRVDMVGIVSYSVDTSVGLLRKAMGSLVDVVYP